MSPAMCDHCALTSKGVWRRKRQTCYFMSIQPEYCNGLPDQDLSSMCNSTIHVDLSSTNICELRMKLVRRAVVIEHPVGFYGLNRSCFSPSDLPL